MNESSSTLVCNSAGQTCVKWKVIGVQVIKQEVSDDVSDQYETVIDPDTIKTEPEDEFSVNMCYSYSEHCHSDSHESVHIKQEHNSCDDKTECNKRKKIVNKTKHDRCDKCGIQKKEIKIHKCSECGKEFKKRWIFIRHQRIHTGEKIYKCNDCGKQYTQLARLKKHRIIHTGEVLHKCVDCNKTFLSEKKYKHHHLTNHPEIELYKCEICNRFYLGLDEFKKHVTTHIEQNSPKVATTADNTAYSIKQEVTGSEEESHEEITVKKEVVDASYGDVDSGLSGKDIFIKAEPVTWSETPKTNEKKHVCSECGKGFNVRSNYNRHRRIHTGEKRYKCEDCPRCFTQLSQLKKHRTVHTGETLYKCKHCGKTFLCEIRYKEHESNHTGEKPYKCDFCNRMFSWPHELKMHVMTHTGEKPFKCDECGRSFARFSNLKGHQKLHAGDKPYSCGDCDKSFSRLSNLKVHQRTHTGEKPYQCEECGCCFSSYSAFRYHCKKVDCKKDEGTKSDVSEEAETSENDGETDINTEITESPKSKQDNLKVDFMSKSKEGKTNSVEGSQEDNDSTFDNPQASDQDTDCHRNETREENSD